MKKLIDNTGHINTLVKGNKFCLYMLGTLQNLRIQCEHILV